MKTDDYIGTTGLGMVSVEALAKHNPSHIYFTGRNSARARTLIDKIGLTKSKTRLTFIECDFRTLSYDSQPRRFSLSESLITCTC